MAALDLKDLQSIDREIDDKGKRYVTYPWLATFLVICLGIVVTTVWEFHKSAKADLRGEFNDRSAQQQAAYCAQVDSLKMLIVDKFGEYDKRMQTMEALHPRKGEKGDPGPRGPAGKSLGIGSDKPGVNIGGTIQ